MQSSLSDIDWSLLRRTLMFSMICIVLGVAIFMLSYDYKLSKDEANERQRFTLLQLTNKSNKTIRDAQTYSDFLPKLKTYQEQGYIGEEHRVLWIDILREITAELKFPNMQYNISEQTKYQHKGNSLPAEGFEIVNSVMQISVDLFHEGDLITLLKTLEKKSKGLFYIDQCSMRRSRIETSFKALESNISAQCDLVWISLQFPQLMAEENNENSDSSI